MSLPPGPRETAVDVVLALAEMDPIIDDSAGRYGCALCGKAGVGNHWAECLWVRAGLVVRSLQGGNQSLSGANVESVRLIEWGPLPTAAEVATHSGPCNCADRSITAWSRWLSENSGEIADFFVRDGAVWRIYPKYDEEAPPTDDDRASRWLPVDAKGLPCARPKVSQ